MNYIVFMVVAWGGAALAGRALRTLLRPYYMQAFASGRNFEAISWIILGGALALATGYSWGHKWQEWLL